MCRRLKPSLVAGTTRSSTLHIGSAKIGTVPKIWHKKRSYGLFVQYGRGNEKPLFLHSCLPLRRNCIARSCVGFQLRQCHWTKSRKFKPLSTQNEPLTMTLKCVL